ncbi:MAG: hypothetical protein ABEJ82_07500 [Haloplanus sp.]
MALCYDLFAPELDADPLRRGLAAADRPVESVLDLAGGTGRAARALDAAVVGRGVEYPVVGRKRGSH